MDRNNAHIAKGEMLLIRITATVLLLACAAALLSQTAFARTTYVINDGGNVMLHTTNATDPAEVLSEAGLELGSEDTYIAQSGSGISEITVQRSQKVFVNLNGREMQLATYGETVQQLLERQQITVDENTEVSVPLDSVTYDGMELTVRSTVTREETYTVALRYETETVKDPTLPVGTQVTQTEGADGAKTVTEAVTYVGGEEVAREPISEQIVTEPVNEVIAIGTGLELEKVEDTVEPVFGETPISIENGTITTASGEVLTYTDEMQVVATGYNKTNEGCNDYTATGTLARVGAIAVDPRMIPYGTRMFIVSNDGEYIYGIATAEDCGGSIKGNRIDLYFDTNAECFAFGRRDCTVYILG